MSAWLDLSANFSAAAATALLAAVWEGIALTAGAYVCLRFLPRLSAAARSIVWLNVFLLLVVLHLLPAAGSHGFATSDLHRQTLELNPIWALAIVAVWALVSFLRCAQLLSSAVRLNRMAARATILPAEATLQPLLRVRFAFGWSRTARLCTSNEVERPSVFGFFRPRILMPPALLQRLTPEELQQVVLHEMEHLRRSDDWTNLLQKLALALFPLNPALLWVERRLCAERELACDDSVLQSSYGRKAYALCLTRLAEHSMLRRSLSLALGAWERQSELVRRVHRILRRPGQSFSRRQTLALTAGLTLCVLLGTLALARSPRLIGFAPQTEEAHATLAPIADLRATRAAEFGLAAHAQMVKAVMPQTSAKTSPAAPAKPVMRTANLHRVRPRPVPSQQAFVVMTNWSDNGVVSQIVLTRAQIDNPPPASTNANQPQPRPVSYAAVRTPLGWLIVEI